MKDKKCGLIKSQANRLLCCPDITDSAFCYLMLILIIELACRSDDFFAQNTASEEVPAVIN